MKLHWIIGFLGCFHGLCLADDSQPPLCSLLRNGTVSIYAIGSVGEQLFLYTSSGHILNLPLTQFNSDANYLELVEENYETRLINGDTSKAVHPKDSHRHYFITENVGTGEPLLVLIYDDEMVQQKVQEHFQMRSLSNDATCKNPFGNANKEFFNLVISSPMFGIAVNSKNLSFSTQLTARFSKEHCSLQSTVLSPSNLLFNTTIDKTPGSAFTFKSKTYLLYDNNVVISSENGSNQQTVLLSDFIHCKSRDSASFLASPWNRVLVAMFPLTILLLLIAALIFYFFYRQGRFKSWFLPTLSQP